MASDGGLSSEEFQRLQGQLLDLKTENYSLNEKLRKQQHEATTWQKKVDDMDRELTRAQQLAKLNPLAFARTFSLNNNNRSREIEQLVSESALLQKKIDDQEEEFRRTNQTLKDEINYLNNLNQSLETQLKMADVQMRQADDTIQMHANNDVTPTPAKDRLDPEKEQLQTRVGELSEQIISLERENQLTQIQLDEFQEKVTQNENIELELAATVKLAEKRKTIIDDMKVLLDEITAKHKAEIDELLREHNEKGDRMEKAIETLNEDRNKLSCTVAELDEGLKTLEAKQLDYVTLEHDLSSARDEIVKLTDENRDAIKKLEDECEAKLNKMVKEYESSICQLQIDCDSVRTEKIDCESKLKKLRQDFDDGIEERKIHEKKGLIMLKELKRQLLAERHRAEKLQEKLQDVLNESTSSSMHSMDVSRRVSTSNGMNDSSSVGSWSFMSSNNKENIAIHDGGTSSQHSGSDGKDFMSPTPPFEQIMNPNSSACVLEEENSHLVSRITKLQQEKWSLEERMNQLEVSNAALLEDIKRKTQIIQFYCMEGRSDPPSHSAQLHQEKLTVKRVVDFIKDKGDENLRDMNRKLQRMLEETLTKNIHLQTDLDTLSEQVAQLNKQRSV